MEIMLTSLLGTFLIGLSFGAGACMFTCIPTLGVTLLSQPLTPGEMMRQTWHFNLGRLSAYSLLGLVSGAAGASVAIALKDLPVNWMFALMLMLSAILLWQSGDAKTCGNHHTRPMQTSLFAMGFGMGLRPCVPLAGVLLAAAGTASMSTGLLLGASFGLGAVVVPQLIFGLALGHAGAQLRSQLRLRQHVLARSGATMLILLATSIGMEWISL